MNIVIRVMIHSGKESLCVLSFGTLDLRLNTDTEKLLISLQNLVRTNLKLTLRRSK